MEQLLKEYVLQNCFSSYKVQKETHVTMSLAQRLECQCNPGKVYASKATFQAHLKSVRHMAHESGKNVRDFQKRLTDAENRIVALEAEVRRLRDLLDNPTRRRVSAVIKKRVAATARWECAVCEQTVDDQYEIDHIVELSRGGNNDIHNLQLLCKTCHKDKTRTMYKPSSEQER